jgi:molybdopterin-guanine dinucleotide biosynthesis protein MobB
MLEPITILGAFMGKGAAMVAVLGFCGASDSGKTTLLTQVVAELSRQGLALGVLKHHGHREPLPPPAEEQGKDTSRYQEAGARRVALVHAGGVRLSTSDGARDDPGDLAQCFMGGLDLVLVEGFKTASLDKIEVVAPGCQPLLPPGGRLLALTRRGGGGVEAGLPVLDADQPRAVAAFVRQHLGLAPRPAQPRVEVRVDGQPLELNPFVSRLVEQTLRGLLERLKGAGGADGAIEVRLG